MSSNHELVCWCENCDGKLLQGRRAWDSHLIMFNVSSAAPPAVVAQWLASNKAAASVQATSAYSQDFGCGSVVSDRPATQLAVGSGSPSRGDRELKNSPPSVDAACDPPSFTDVMGGGDDSSVEGELEFPPRSRSASDSDSESTDTDARDGADSDVDVRDGAEHAGVVSQAAPSKSAKFLDTVLPAMIALLLPDSALSSGEPARLDAVVQELAAAAASQV
jgi:hypothetical protein